MVKNWRKAGAQQPLAKGLGGGLQRPSGELLFGSSDGLRDTVMLRLHDVSANPHQPRRHFDEGELAALANSLREVGQLSPVLVKPDPKEPKRFILVAGERRWRAADMAGLGRIMAHILPPEANADQIALIENLQRVGLSPVEEAEGIRRLVDAHDYDQETVGDLLGRSRTEVNTTLTLLKLAPEIRQECVTSHTGIPKAVLLELARMEPGEQTALWPLVREGRMTARQAREHRTQPVTPATGAADQAPARRSPVPADPDGTPRPLSPKRFIATLPKLEDGLETGIKAVAARAAKLKPEERERLQTLREKLRSYTQSLDRILNGP